ncbi:MAG: signal peptide peptidase SppA [Bradymonadia bacterium]
MLRLLWALPLWLLLLPLALVRWLISRFQRSPRVLEVVLEGDITLLPQPKGPFRRGGSGGRGALRSALRTALKDQRVQTIFVRIGSLEGGLGHLSALRALLGSLKVPRGNGAVKVVAYVHQPTTRALWVASSADEIIIPKHTPVMAMGTSLEINYYGEGLEKAGIDVDVVAAGAFKSAMEPFTRTEPSEASREALEALLGDLHDGLVADLGARPGRTPEQIEAALASGPHLADQAVALGLADAALDLEEVDARLDCHDDGKASKIHLDDHPGVIRPWPRKPRLLPQKAPLAVIPVVGDIRDGKLEGPERSKGAIGREVVELADAARKNKSIKGVLLYIDSRGGSATASEEMWRAVRRLAKKKPVVAWMGDYAASGGYYLASAAHHIVACPTTLTGSIGVIAAKPHVERLLARLGVHTTRLERGPQSTMFSLSRGFTEAERAAMEATITAFYDLFLARVGEGRDRTPESVHPVAQGRVWTGQQALAHALVDALGDEEAAIRTLSAMTGVSGRPPLRVLRPHRPLMERLLSGIGAQAAASAATPAALTTLMEAAEGALPPEGDALAWCPITVRTP